MLWILYNLLFPVVFACMLPKFLLRMARRGGYRENFGQRLGCYRAADKERLRARRRVWVHAVSVGEIYVALRFIKAYRAACPGAFFALSTTTSTAHAIGRREIDPRDVLFYFPVDLPGVVGKVLRIVDPLRIVLVEGELWPNLVRLADRRKIPVSLVNGRMSASSFRGYRRLRPLMADVLRRVDPICVQGEADARRMAGLGAPPSSVHAMGTAKFDVAGRDPDGEAAARGILRRIGVRGDAVVLLGGSTWPGEEAALCALYRRFKPQCPNLFLVVVPRHVERAAEVAGTLEREGIAYVRRSQLGQVGGDGRPAPPDALFVDTTGELRSFYSAADIIFVGKSLHGHGGQNPIEPALYGKAIVVGPNMENFPEVMAEFLRHGAVRQVRDAEELAEAVGGLLADPAGRAALGRRAAEVVERNRGVIERTVALMGA